MYMKKQKLAVAACIGCLTLFAAGGSVLASSPVLEVGQSMETDQGGSAASEAGSLKYEMVTAWGQIKSIDGDRIVMENLGQTAVPGEVVIQIRPRITKCRNTLISKMQLLRKMVLLS